jgi:hypothetical protein
LSVLALTMVAAFSSNDARRNAAAEMVRVLWGE